MAFLAIKNHPQHLSGLSRALFPTTFLDTAVSLNVTVIVISCLMIASREAWNSELQINVFELVRLQ